MWKSASKPCLSHTGVLTRHVQEFSKDGSNSTISKDDGLECPICCESFNIVENVPYVLWCGRSLCKNCVLSLQWAVVKINSSLILLPLLISCPWCNLLSLRLVLRGNLKFPHKNYVLMWMVERINSDHQVKSHTDDSRGDFQPLKLFARSQTTHSNVQTIVSSHHQSLSSFLPFVVLVFHS